MMSYMKVCSVAQGKMIEYANLTIPLSIQIAIFFPVNGSTLLPDVMMVSYLNMVGAYPISLWYDENIVENSE